MLNNIRFGGGLYVYIFLELILCIIFEIYFIINVIVYNYYFINFYLMKLYLL